MPAFWLAVAAVIAPISSGPTKDVTLPVSANSPKYCATRSFGASRMSSEREAACRADAAAEDEIGPLGGGSEQRAARLRRPHLHEQHRILVDQQDRDNRKQ